MAAIPDPLSLDPCFDTRSVFRRRRHKLTATMRSPQPVEWAPGNPLDRISDVVLLSELGAYAENGRPLSSLPRLQPDRESKTSASTVIMPRPQSKASKDV